MVSKLSYLLMSIMLISFISCGEEDIINEPEPNDPFLANYPIVDTGITTYYDDESKMSMTSAGQAFHGQDASYIKNQPSYTDNGDGTITDNITGLIWAKDMGQKLTHEDALVFAESSVLGGHTDWRVPSIKELYSLILFTGSVRGEHSIGLFIDDGFLNQPIGNTELGEREIDAQTWSATTYVGRTMNADETIFGVNFIDGRIKGYPKYKPGSGNASKMYVRIVRGNTNYGLNDFIDNYDGTISDLSTGLMWQKSDDGVRRNWEQSLSYSENLSVSGYDDWRLPNAKELQSIVDYTRSPQTTNSPAINPLFETTEIYDMGGITNNYPFFWTSTTHLDGVNPYRNAVYIAFGEGYGKMNGVLMDVHGAGCQRSDPKSGAMEDYPQYFGPQGDLRLVYNYVRSVRDID